MLLKLVPDSRFDSNLSTRQELFITKSFARSLLQSNAQNDCFSS